LFLNPLKLTIIQGVLEYSSFYVGNSVNINNFINALAYCLF